MHVATAKAAATCMDVHAYRVDTYLTGFFVDPELETRAARCRSSHRCRRRLSFVCAFQLHAAPLTESLGFTDPHTLRLQFMPAPNPTTRAPLFSNPASFSHSNPRPPAILIQ